MLPLMMHTADLLSTVQTQQHEVLGKKKKKRQKQQIQSTKNEAVRVNEMLIK